MIYSTITFYKYEKIENPGDVVDNLRLLCEELNLLGRIIVGKEGINAGISGKKENIDKFKLEICKVFENLTFREHFSEKNSYHKLVVRTTKEFEQKITELRNNDCNPIKESNKEELITFPVFERVRVNDKVFVFS